MVGKLVFFLGLVAVVLAQADKYPAGLNAALCPNYPYCDNTIIALYGSHNVPATPVATGRSYPAGVHPAACPNYPFCGGVAPAGYYAREYPAGVHPAACPNYPYCY